MASLFDLSTLCRRYILLRFFIGPRPDRPDTRSSGDLVACWRDFLYAKLQTGLLLGAAAAWILYDGRARSVLLTAGPWLGAAVFLVTVSPLINWLTASDFS